ncbi:MAG TPA: MerR family transcriptional regulator [Limnochordales bacterium]
MPGVDPSVPVYPIGVVQRLTGLSARQIRYYEQEGLLAPGRSRGNRRLYSLADVERLRRIKELLEQGLTLEGVRALLATPERAAAAGPTPVEQATAAAPGGTGHPPPGAGERAPVEGSHLPEAPVDPAIFRQARGRRLSSLFPVDQQAELMRLLERQRQQEETWPSP